MKKLVILVSCLMVNFCGNNQKENEGQTNAAPDISWACAKAAAKKKTNSPFMYCTGAYTYNSCWQASRGYWTGASGSCDAPCYKYGASKCSAHF